MAKKLNNQETDGNLKPVSENPQGIKSFLKEDMKRSKVEYTEEKADKILAAYDNDYDKIINDAGKRAGVKDADKFRTGIYGHYGLTKRSEEEVAEMDFIKKPISTDAEDGYGKYQQLQDEAKLAGSMVDRLKPKEEELSLMPDLKQPSDVTRVSVIDDLDKDKFLTPEQKKLQETEDYNQKRIVNLQTKMEEINVASAEQAALNVKEFGYASKEHEAVGKEFENYSTLLDKAIKEKASHSEMVGFSLGGAMIKSKPEDVKKVKNLRNIKELYSKMGKVLGSPQGENFTAQMDGLLHGFSDSFFTKDFATLGLNEMGRLLNVKDAFDTQNKFKAEGKTEEEIAELMPEEQKALLDTYKMFLEVQAGTKGNFGSVIGEGLKEMIPFIAQFAATGGVGTGAKKLVKEFVEAKTKKAIVGRIAGAIAKPLAQAVVMFPAELQNYAQRVAPTMDGFGNLIEGQEPINAAFKAYITTVAEVAGEDVGVFTNKWANKAARKNFTKLIANNPDKAQMFLGKMSLALTRETNMPGIQGFVFEGLGEEATGIMQAAIDNDGNFFTAEAQKQIWAMSLMASGGFAAFSVPGRINTKMKFNKATDLLNDIPNADYAKAAEDIADNYQDATESLEALDAISKDFDISEEDYLKARNFIGSSAMYNQMNTARALQVEERIAQSLGSDGNVTLTSVNGEVYSVRNPQDLGKGNENKVIYLKNQDGTKVTPIISSKVVDYETKSPDVIIDEQVSQQDVQDEAVTQEQQMQEEATEKGLIEGNTVETPKGKRTLVSVNPDGTTTVTDDKGEESVVNTSEIEAYKTTEQKDAEKEEIKQQEEADALLMEGIEEGSTITSDEPLTEESEIRVVDFSNGQSKIITPEGETIYNTPEERDAGIGQLVSGEMETTQEDIDELPAEQAFDLMRKENPEIAIELFTGEIQDMRAQAEEARSQVKETKSRKEKQSLLLKAKELENEAERLDAILADPTLLEQEVEVEEQVVDEVAPVEEAEPLNVEAVAEQLNQEYLTEQETTPFNSLTPWQQDLVGMKVGRGLFVNTVGKQAATDSRKETTRWFIPKAKENNSHKIDNIAEELSETHKTEVTVQDIVDFILENPTNSVRKTSDRMTDIATEYRDLTGKSIKNHVQAPVEVASEVEGIGKVEEVADVPFRAGEPEPINIFPKAQEDLKGRKRIVDALTEMQEQFGIPVNVVNWEEVPEAVLESSTRLRGGVPKGFYYQGQVYVVSNPTDATGVRKIARVSDAKMTYLHEAVLHNGLDIIFEAGPVTLLGKEYKTKDNFLDGVFSRLDEQTIADRARVYGNIPVDQLTDPQKRELAEEALATLNETESPRLQVMLDKLYNYIKKVFGFTSKQFTKADLRNLLREHRDLVIGQKKGTDVSGKVDEEVKFRTELASKDLVVLHNLDGGNILHSDKLGGIPVPSLAITKKDIPFTGFGDITLIGGVEMVDPKLYGNKTFAADAYSPRTPTKLFSVGRRGYDDLTNKLQGDSYKKYGRELWNKVNSAIGGSNLEREIETYDPKSLVHNYKDRDGMKIAFLSHKDIPLKMPTKSTKLAYGWNNQYFDDITKTDLDWIKENKKALGAGFGSEDVETEKHKLLTDFFINKANGDAIETYGPKDGAIIAGMQTKSNIGEDGLLTFSSANILAESIKDIANKKKVPDEMKLRGTLEKKFNRKLQKEYEAWLEDVFGSVQGEEYFEKGRKKVPYNLDNLVDAMSGKIRGEEGTVFKSLAGAKAKNVKQFSSVRDIKSYEDILVSGERMDIIKEELNNEFFKLTESVGSYYEYDNSFGKLDDMSEALADYVRTGSLSSALSRNGFKKVPSYYQKDIKDFAAKLMSSPTQYFESKPQRAVELKEFRGAVVPKGTDKRVLDVLRSNGVTVNYYDKGKDGAENKENRRGAVQKFAERSKVMFRTAESTKELDDFVKDSSIKETVYHGTPNATYDEFREGTMFTKNKTYAERYINQGASSVQYKKTADRPAVYSTRLNMENPFDTRNEEARDIFEGEYRAMLSPDITERGLVDWMEADDLAEWLQENYPEYDGLVLDEGGEPVMSETQQTDQYQKVEDGIGWRGESYYIFNPDQALVESIEDVEQPKFRVAESKQELDDFVKDSKVKETVYHATSAEFDEFDVSKSADGAIWFSFDKESTLEKQQSGEAVSRIIDAKIDLKNPAGWDEYDKYSIDELINEGYDGAVLDDDVIVFESNQILIEPKEDVRLRVDEAAEQVETDPSDAQKESGNYKMGHVKFDGFDVSIENPKGSIRSGMNQEGEKWSNIMPANYGYFKGTIGNDKDHIDTFMGDNMESDKVYVVDQVDPVTGKFDEHKVMMGYNSLSEAKTAYNEAYDEGWAGLGAITRTTKDGLKEWFKGNTKKPFAPKAEVKFRLGYKLDNHNAEYFVRFSDNIDEDLKRGWSSWNFGEEGFDGTREELDTLLESATDSNPVWVSGFDIYPDQINDFEFGELYDNYWVAKDNINTPGELSAHVLPDDMNAIDDALTESNAPEYDGTGDGESFDAKNAKVIYTGNKNGKEFHILEVGENKIKQSEDVKFRATSTNPEIQKMLDKLQAVQDLGKANERIKGLEDEAKQTLPQDRQTILDKLEGIKEGAKLGAKDTKELIKAVQKEITDYAKKSMPLGEAGSRDIGSILTLIKEAQTPEAIEKAFERIDELTGQNVDKIARKKHISKVNRILKWMTGLKKSGTKKVGKFNYTDSKQFQELKDINKQAIDLVKKTNSHKASAEEKTAASAQLETMWNDLSEKPDKNALDDAMMKLIELRRLGSKASPKLAQIVSEELEAIYLTAKEAKSQVDMIKGMERRADKDMIQSFLQNDRSLKKLPWYKKAMTQINTGVADIMGNWETLMTMIGGTELRDKMSFMLNEADIVVGKQQTNDALLNAAKEIYNVDSKTGTLNKVHELSKMEYELRQPNRKGRPGAGDAMELSKLHLMDIYNAIKNSGVEYDYYMTYGDIILNEDGSRDSEAQMKSGKNEITSLLNNLSSSDKEFADEMMKTAQTYKESTNDVFIKIYNRDMPTVENYWPSTAEFEADIDVMSEFVSSGKMPSFSSERASHRKPIPKDAFNKFTKHIDESEWYKNMAIPIMNTSNLFKDKNIETLLTDKRGAKFYRHLKDALQAITLTPPTSVLSSKLTSLLNPLLNNWVASKIGATPSVPLKQLLSAVNYAENMPAEQWAAGFVKGMASPKETWKTMMEIPYLKARLGDGYSEAVQRALNGDENVHKAKAKNYHTAFKNLMTIGTRYGDITAIIFGGKPYLDYLLKEKGMSQKEAVDKFLQDTLRSQQAPFASTLSKLQNSKNPFFRAIFAFSNTPSQYMRKLFEANQNLRVQKKQLEAGKISQEDYNKARKQTIKAHTIYGLVNTVSFTMAGSLINALMKGSDADDEIWKDMLNQLGQTYTGGLPVIKDLIGGMTRQSLGMPIYDDSKPFVEGLDEVVSEGIKIAKGDSKDLDKSYEKVAQGVATMLAVPYYNIKKTIKSFPPYREETLNATRVKEVGYKLNKLNSGSDRPLADTAREIKKAYSSAKRKAKKLSSEGKHTAAGRITKLIEKSKVHLWDTDYSVSDINGELKMFDRMVDRIK